MATLQQLKFGLTKAHEAGRTDHAQVFADAIREHPTFREQAQASLSSGSFQLGGDNIKLGKDDMRQQMGVQLSRSLGLRDDAVDVTKGMGAWGRLKLDFQPDEQSRVDYLKGLYGEDNIYTANIGGENRLMFRDDNETGGAWRLVDEEGFSLADITSDIAGEAVTTAGAIGGAALGTALAPGAGTALGTTMGATAGAAIGGFLTGLSQDIATEAVTGQEVEFGKHTGKRAKEAAWGIPLDLATAGTARFASKWAAGRDISQMAGEGLDSLRSILSRTGGDKSLLSDIPLTAQQAVKRQDRLAKSPSGWEASRISRVHDEVEKIIAKNRGELGDAGSIQDTIMREANDLRARMFDRASRKSDINEELDFLKKEAAKEGRELKWETQQRLLKQSADNAAAEEASINLTIDRMVKNQLRNSEELRTDAGDKIRESILAGEKNDQSIVKGLYDQANRMIKAPIYRIRDKHSVAPISRAYRKVMKKFNIADPKDETSYKLLEARFGKRIADDLLTLNEDLAMGKTVDFSKLNSMTRNLESMANWKKASGFSENEVIIKELAQSMIKVRDKALGDIGAAPREAWKKANDEWRKRIAPRGKGINQSARELVPGGSGPAVDSAKLADQALGSSLAVKQAVKQADNPNEMRGLLRGHYFSKLLSDAGAKPVKVSYDELRPLYRDAKDAKAAVGRLKEINRLIGSRGVKPETVTEKMISDAMGDPLLPSSKKAMKLIKEQVDIEASEKADVVVALKKMVTGDAPIHEDIYNFSDEFVKLQPKEQKQLFDRLPDEFSKSSLKRSNLDSLLQKHASGGQVGSKRFGSQMIFNPDTMLEDLLKNSGKWTIALGEVTYDDMLASARVLKSSRIPKPRYDSQGNMFVPKADVTGGGGVIFYATKPVRWLGRKTMDLLHGSGKISHMLESLTAERGEVSEEFFKQALIKLMATQGGVAAIVDEANKDKNFGQWVQNELGDI
jgi:hypothetical protein